MTMPGITAAAKDFYMDMPLTAAIAFVVWQLFKTNGFRNTRESVMFALCFGLGMWVKEVFILYLGPGLLIYWLNIMKDQSTERRKRLINLSYSAIIALSLVSIIYLPIIVPMLKNYMTSVGDSNGHFYARPFAMNEIGYYTYYFGILLNWEASFFYVVVPLIIFYITLIMRKMGEADQVKINMHSFLTIEWLVIFSWILIPLLVLTFCVEDSCSRFVIPILPAIAFCSAKIVIAISNLTLRKIIIIFLISIGYLNFYAQSFGISWLPQQMIFKNALLWDQQYNRSPYFKTGKPQQENWFILSIFEIMKKNIPSGCKTPKVALLVESPLFNQAVFDSYKELYHYSFQFETIPVAVSLINKEKVFQHMKKVPFEFLMIRSLGSVANTVTYYKKIAPTLPLVKAMDYFLMLINQGVYDEIGKFSMPDHSFITLYVLHSATVLSSPYS